MLAINVLPDNQQRAFRSQFPALSERVYLNAGTEGPVPAAAARDVSEELARGLAHGRVGPEYFQHALALADQLRGGYAQVMGAAAGEVALTSSTTYGINTVLGGLRLNAGEEILTSDQEHPGVLAPLRRARLMHGVRVRVVPFNELPGEVGASTRLVVCSHVSWVSGAVMDVQALCGTGVPVLLDGAQGLGAVEIDVHTLGVDYYAASGQKWLCGPEGSGALYVRPDRLDDLEPPFPGYWSVSHDAPLLDAPLADGTGARLDDGFPTVIRSVWALAALGVLNDAGWDWIHRRAASGAVRLAAKLAERGLEVAQRGASTLVSWHVNDAEAEVKRLAEQGIVVRSIPASGLVRASVGAWTSDEEIESLAVLAAA
ncbi:MAG: aminotransferase class V-fold PLP-dependent enzyme [Solirubrobacteraceae bacterium]